jgi:ABC-type branched-subunit amino acid transport system substrate-binding protein
MRPVRTLAALLSISLLSTACDSGAGAGEDIFPRQSPLGRPTSSDTLVIGLVGTMTGPDSWRGEDAYEGADLAVHHLNQLQGDDERPFELITLDDNGDADDSIALIENLADLERTVGIIYAGPPDALPEAETALAGRGIPGILLYGDLYGARRLTAHTFQMGSSFLWEARRLASYIDRDRGYRNVGALVELTSTGRTAQRAVNQALRNEGLRRAEVVRYDASDQDLLPALSQLRQERVECIVFQGGPAAFGRVLRTLSEMGAGYRTTSSARIASATRRQRRQRIASNHWRPQVLGFDGVFSPRQSVRPRPGTVVTAPLGRGLYYLPVPTYTEFREAFAGWWDEEPLGWQPRAYDAARMIGWAAQRAAPNEDIAVVLESMEGERFSATDITLGPDDHMAVDQITVGLWVVPRPGIRVRERARRPSNLPWVPLARGFSIDGRNTDIPALYWESLFRNPPPPQAPAPVYTRMKFGVRTGPRDPVH